MAALAQPVPLEATIREALAPLTLPAGVVLKAIELRGNSHGEPSVYVTYAFTPNGSFNDDYAKKLLDLQFRVLDVLRTFRLPLFEYVNFVEI